MTCHCLQMIPFSCFALLYLVQSQRQWVLSGHHKRLFYNYLTVQFVCLVTRCFVVFVPQVPSSQHSQCCVALAVTWSPSGDFVVCSGSTWLQPSSRYWQLSSWLGGSWASSGEWTWSSWQVSIRPAVLFCCLAVCKPCLIFLFAHLCTLQ